MLVQWGLPVRLEAYDGKMGESSADLGAPVVKECKDMESRGGGSIVKVGVGGGGAAAAAAEESASSSTSPADAQPMGVEVRVSSYFVDYHLPLNTPHLISPAYHHLLVTAPHPLNHPSFLPLLERG